MAGGFKVAEADRTALESWLRAPSVAQGLALRAKVILASAQGEGVRPMARRLGISPNTVAVWRRRYRTEGLGYPKPRCQTADTLTRRAAQHDARSGRQRLRDTLRPQPVPQLGPICSAYFHPASLYAHAE
jgi:transposase-like protein